MLNRAGCRITVALPGLDHEFGGPAEFADELRAPDLPDVRDLTIAVGNTWASDPLAVAITWSRSFGVTLTVTGSDRAVVVGAAQVLKDRIDEGGHKRGVEPLLAGLVGWLIAAVLSFAVGLVHFRTGNQPSDPYALVFLAGWSLFGYGSYLSAQWCFPRVELLSRGQPSRWARVRKHVLGAVLFVAAAVAGVVASRLL